MSVRKHLPRVLAICAIVLGFLAIRVPAVAATKEKILYSFCSENNCVDGKEPVGDLVFDLAGNLYGAAGGGQNGSGVVFELTPNGNGTWGETVLYNFCSSDNCTDGGGPTGSLIFDAAGNLFGMTTGGGRYGTSCGGGGCGTVFELSPNGDGTWKETVIHNFNDDGEDGWEPVAGLTPDASGNLYGTTFGGGAAKSRTCNVGCGVVFALTPGKGGKWKETILHHFCSLQRCSDGHNPLAGVTFDQRGHLYGTTSLGGSHNCGTKGCGLVFQLTEEKNGKWKEKVLYSFGGGKNEGGAPQTTLALDAVGNVYGTSDATIFGLQKNKSWNEKILSKTGSANSLVFDTAGNIYSTTPLGGGGYGTVFELKPRKSGTWTQRTLHIFNNDGNDGTYPFAGPILDAAGDVYGTTFRGGNPGVMCDGFSGCGTVFEITP